MKTGHSPQFMQEMKQRLLAEQVTLTQELSVLEKRGQTRFPEYGRQDEDNAMEMADYESARATTKALEERLAQVRQALERIEQGTYGLTKDDQLIPEDRLRANPAATTLIEK